MSKKTNIEYLHEFIKDNEEAIEFLNAIEEQLKDRDDDVDNLKDEIKQLEQKNASLNSEIEELQVEKELNNTIKTPIGTIEWEANNLQHMAIFEALEEKLKTKSPNEIAAAIESL